VSQYTVIISAIYSFCNSRLVSAINEHQGHSGIQNQKKSLGKYAYSRDVHLSTMLLAICLTFCYLHSFTVDNTETQNSLLY
jgi:hypothetical protein